MFKCQSVLALSSTEAVFMAASPIFSSGEEDRTNTALSWGRDRRGILFVFLPLAQFKVSESLSILFSADNRICIGAGGGVTHSKHSDHSCSTELL